jgi:hypothetical protein
MSLINVRGYAQPGRNARQALGLAALVAGLLCLLTPRRPDCWPGEASGGPRETRVASTMLAATAGKTH